jgi:hypothetical protein
VSGTEDQKIKKQTEDQEIRRSKEENEYFFPLDFWSPDLVFVV